jgi:murein DD-endopeptidase MepM/ murein hydrolase activator NlpD
MKFLSKTSILYFFIFLSTIGGKSQQLTYSITKNDSTNIYRQMLNDISDDLMENHPADDIYNNIWTREKLNPYKIPIDSLPDSVLIDCSDFVMPCQGAITSSFGPRRYRYHFGTDLRVHIGDSILSAFSGRIRIIDYEARGYGNYVVVRHDNGLETVYAHLSEVLVAENQDVKAGDLIGLGGNTGRSTGPHLHFEIRYIGNAINPELLIDFTAKKIKNEQYLITKKKTFHYQREVNNLSKVKYYTVRKGDNLSRIAARNGVSVKVLCKMNGIKQSTCIRPGQRLRVH